MLGGGGVDDQGSFVSGFGHFQVKRACEVNQALEKVDLFSPEYVDV